MEAPARQQHFQHLILTRFNTAIDYAPSRKRLESGWLTERLALFEQFCLPSMRSQRNAEFQWLVFFDDESPQWFKDKVESFRPLLSPLYIAGPATDAIIADIIRRTNLVTAPFLITTRLDNDDSLAATHLAFVQQAFKEQEREFIEFPFGLQLFRNMLYSVYWPSNPFLSLIERVPEDKSFTTVLTVPHNYVRHAGRVKSLHRSPQWLQVIHSSNVLNSLRGWPRISARSHPNFQIVWPEQHTDSFMTRVKFSMGTYASRGGKVISRALAKLGA